MCGSEQIAYFRHYIKLVIKHIGSTSRRRSNRDKIAIEAFTFRTIFATVLQSVVSLSTCLNITLVVCLSVCYFLACLYNSFVLFRAQLHRGCLPPASLHCFKYLPSQPHCSYLRLQYSYLRHSIVLDEFPCSAYVSFSLVLVLSTIIVLRLSEIDS